MSAVTVRASGAIGGPLAVGVRDTAPLAVAIVPFALAIGAATAEAGVPLLAGWVGGLVLLAGSAQLVLTETLGAGGTLLAAAGAAVLVNARFALYSAGLARWFPDAPRWRTLLLAVPLVDQQFMLCQQRFTTDHDDRWRVRYYLAVSATLVVAYLGVLPIGYSIGSAVPAGAGLHLAAPLAFAGMLGSSVKARADLVAALVAAGAVVAVTPAVGGAALPLAAIAGVAVGGVVPEARR